MRKILNILLLVFTLSALLTLCGFFAYNHFHKRLNDVNITIIRNSEDGFLNYEERAKLIMNVCDTVNNDQINKIPLDTLISILETDPWTINVDAQINLKAYLDIELTECEPVVRIYNTSRESIYIDNEGNIFPTKKTYTPRLLIGSGHVNFPSDNLGNVNDETYSRTDLPEMYMLMKKVLSDDYAKRNVKQIFKDRNKNYIFSLNNTNIIVIFGDVNNIEEKLLKMQHFFDKMQGNPELENYKEINLNFKNQVVCTKNKNK